MPKTYVLINGFHDDAHVESVSDSAEFIIDKAIYASRHKEFQNEFSHIEVWENGNLLEIYGDEYKDKIYSYHIKSYNDEEIREEFYQRINYKKHILFKRQTRYILRSTQTNIYIEDMPLTNWEDDDTFSINIKRADELQKNFECSIGVVLQEVRFVPIETNKEGE